MADLTLLKKMTDTLFVEKREVSRSKGKFEDNMNEPAEYKQMLREDQSRLALVKSCMGVSMPKEAAKARTYNSRGTADTMSKSKRKTRSGMLGSALRTKKVQAQSIVDAEKNYNTQLTQKLNNMDEELPDLNRLDVSEETAEAFKVLIAEYNSQNEEAIANTDISEFIRVRDYAQNKETQTKQRASSEDTLEKIRRFEGSADYHLFVKNRDFEFINKLTKAFVTMDTNGIDISTDKAFAASAPKLEQLKKTYESINTVLKEYPFYLEQLSDEAKQMLNEKLTFAGNITEYYETKKDLLTDANYKLKYNSELSYTYNENDSLEDRELTIKIIKSEKALAKLKPELALAERAYMDIENKDQVTLESRAIRSGTLLLKREVKAAAKNEHANSLYKMVYVDKPLFEGLTKRNYVNNSRQYKGYGQPLFSDLSAFFAMQSVAHADVNSIMTMFKNLTTVSEDSTNPASRLEARNKNEEGFREFFNLVRQQVNYVKAKYGMGIGLMTIQEITLHSEEIDEDLKCFTQNLAILNYCKNSGFWNENEEMETLLKEVSYYEMQTRALQLIVDNIRDENWNYIENRIASDKILNSKQGKELKKFMGDMPKSVQWGKLYDENNITLKDLEEILSSKDKFKAAWNNMKGWVEQQDIEFEPKWFNIIASMRAKYGSVEEAINGIEEMIKAEAKLSIASNAKGINLGALSLQGNLGPDDTRTISAAYFKQGATINDIMSYGCTEEEAQEYMDLLKQSEEIGRQHEYYQFMALNTYFFQNSDRNGNTMQKLKYTLGKDFEQKNKEYEETRDELKAQAVDILQKIMDFRAKHNMFVKDEHHQVYKEIIGQQCAALKKDVEFDISNINIKTYKLEYIKSEKGLDYFVRYKHLKSDVKQEDFVAAINEYNNLLSQYIVIGEYVDLALIDPVNFKSTDIWKKLECDDKGFLANDLFNKLSVVVDQMDVLKEQIQDMLEL